MIALMSVMLLHIVLALNVVLLIAFYFSVYRKHKRMTYAYPLYAVRDKLVWLVASGKLQESDFLFQFFYKSVNIFIQNKDFFTLQRLINVIEDVRSKGYDPSQEQDLKKIQRELATADQEVKDAVNSFYKAVLYLFVLNSPLLSRYGLLEKYVAWTSSQKTARVIRGEYQNASQAIACAA